MKSGGLFQTRRAPVHPPHVFYPQDARAQRRDPKSRRGMTRIVLFEAMDSSKTSPTEGDKKPAAKKRARSDESDAGKDETADEKIAFIRERNALYSRRLYHKRKIELEVLENETLKLQKEQAALQQECARLMGLTRRAEQVVMLIQQQELLSAASMQNPTLMAASPAALLARIQGNFPPQAQQGLFHRPSTSLGVNTFMPPFMQAQTYLPLPADRAVPRNFGVQSLPVDASFGQPLPRTASGQTVPACSHHGTILNQPVRHPPVIAMQPTANIQPTPLMGAKPLDESADPPKEAAEPAAKEDEV